MLQAALLIASSFPHQGPQPPAPPIPAQPAPAQPAPVAPSAEEGRRNRLGVYAVSTPRGVLITEVVSDQPAAQAGLQAGDLILKVDGYPVGIIQGVDYPLHSEVRRARGVARFEVREARTGQVVEKPIRVGPDVPPELPRLP
jgi:S1-C subfamily serine protease